MKVYIKYRREEEWEEDKEESFEVVAPLNYGSDFIWIYVPGKSIAIPTHRIERVVEEQ